MEIWKSIPGYTDQYEVSNLGRVRSMDRAVWCQGPVKGGYWSIKKGRLLRPGRMPQGHLSVAFGRGNSQCVHKLVLLAFVGAAPRGHECRHLDGDPANNNISNLQWGTRSENIQDAVRHGTWMTPERLAGAAKGRAVRWGRA